MRKTVNVTLVLYLIIALSACGSGGAPPASDQPAGATEAADGTTAAGGLEPATPEGPEYGGILRLIGGGDTNESWGFPWRHTTGAQGILVPFGETLLVGLSDGSYEPFLAESYETDTENNEVRFKLREGIKFTDGSDFNAEAAVWNYMICIEEGRMNPAVVGAEVRGEYEMAVLLDDYFNGALDMAASHVTSMVSKENYEKNGEAYALEHPAGTGPFILAERVPGSKVVFTRNEDYWQEGKPYLDGVEYVAIADFMTQIAAMQSTSEEAADVLELFSAEQVAMLRDDENLDILASPMGPVCLLPSSMDESSPLSKLEIRQAISYAIDREVLCKARGFEILTPALQLIPEPFQGPLPDSYNLSYDPDKARELLAQAGYPDGFATTLYGMPGIDQDIIVALQSMLETVGIRCEMEFPESGAATDLRANGWDGMLMLTVRSLANMTVTFFLHMDPDMTQMPSMWRPVEEMRPIYEASRSTPEVEDELIQELHKLMLDHMVMIPVYDTYDTFIVRNNVHGGGFSEWSAATQWMPADTWKSAK